MHEGKLVDAVVKAQGSSAHEYTQKREYPLQVGDRLIEIDLNSLNHCAQTFDSAE